MLVLGAALFTAAAAKPTIFVLGDSTARNTAKGKNGEPCAGWGTPLADYFDADKVAVANVAHAGTSSRSYFNNPGDWPAVLPQIKAGDFVLLVFGINDGAAPPNGRGSLPGTGDETVEVKRDDGSIETAHTYGWYMSTMVTLAREQGAHVTFLTVTTRDIWTNPAGIEFRAGVANKPLPADYDPKLDHIERGTGNGRYTQWTKDLGAKLHLPVLDLTNLCADRYEAMGRATVDKFYSDHNHTYVPGADFVAATIVSGLKAFPKSPFAALLSEKGRAVATADAKYVSENRAP
jgi:lysophospholipase L1-like esterase